MNATRAKKDYNTPLERSRRMMRRAAIGYATLHERIHKSRGQASAHLCHGCGVAPAAEWAYDHTDPNERYDRDNGSRFSMDIGRYNPMCVPCHRRFDHVPYGQRTARPVQHRVVAPIRQLDTDTLTAATRSRRDDLKSILSRVRDVG